MRTLSVFSLLSAFPNPSVAVAGRRQFRLRGLLVVPLLIALAGVPWAYAVDSKASGFYEDALSRYEKRDVSGAIIQLKNALQIDPTLLPVQVLLGKALLQNGEVVAAERALLEAMRLGVSRAEVALPLGEAFLAQGKQARLVEDALFDPAELPALAQRQLWLLRAAAWSDLGDLNKALKAVEEAQAADPQAPAAWMAEVPIRIRFRQLDEANAAAAKALALAPTSAQAWYLKGAASHVLGDVSGTQLAYARALALDEAHVEARLARAGLRLDMGQDALAQADVTLLRQLAPTEPRALYLQALLAERDKKPEVAKKALKDLVGLLDPVPLDFVRYRPQLLLLNGLAHDGLGELEKARFYLEAFQKVQGDTPATKLLAQVYVRSGKVDAAMQVLEAYLRSHPADGQAMTLLGAALMAKGQNARAATLMQQALQTRDTPAFRTVLGLSLLRSGQSASGVAELEAAYQKNPQQIHAATALIGQYLQGGQPARAVSLAQRLVSQHPQHAGFVTLLGLAQGQAGDLNGASRAFQQAMTLDPALMAPRLNLVRLEIGTRAYGAAAASLEAILKVDAKNPEAMYESAVLADRQGDPALAQRWLEKATALAGPGELRWGLALSDFHLRYGRAAQALEAVKNVSIKRPQDLAVLLTYARAQLGMADLAGARSTLTSATRVADYEPKAQLEIALLQMSAANLAGAAYSLEKALSTQPDFLPAQALLAEVELKQGELAKAEKRARAMVSHHPRRAVGHSLLGDLASLRGQYPLALASYQRAHQLEPTSDTLTRQLRVMAAQSSGKGAQMLADGWLSKHPRDVAVQKALADHHARSGDFGLARVAYQRALQIAPTDPEALNNLANVLIRLKDPGAIAAAEKALVRSADNANVIDTLGWALFQGGQTERALAHLRDARLRAPNQSEIRYHLAVVLTQTGRRTEAREELEAALRQGRAFEGMEQAQALLKSLPR